ncbi:hypothetical protein F2Q69_00024031 [Brassica cretica]|uniref:Replication factor A C-terminal domain-containing protein n=1 Tax=Brassica cretica TaxID=69181 RepID=A0A8S9Q9Q0_BRACR|nr:hypothetical protein F2Q69_00024031 [Brassica cretica]
MKQLSKLLCSFDSHFPEISDDHKNNYATVDSLGSKISPVVAVCLYSFTYSNLLLLSWLNVTTLVWKKTGNNPDPSLLRGYAKVEPLSISKLNDFIIAAEPQVHKKLQRTDSSFTCVSCNNTSVVGVLWYQMEMSIADDMDEGLFVAFDGEMKKLHNMRAYEAGHLMAGEGVNLEETQPPPFIADIVGKTYSFQVRDGDDDDGDDLPGNTSALPNVGIEGNERVETSSTGTSSSGPATKKPLPSTSGQVVNK